ncbi:MAG: hypothetical protein P4L53_15725 [Candidatus Obscuribacterales bacterium]|nr:hypothetical protein [Candidatus Obscuribacterales bacterium]
MKHRAFLTNPLTFVSQASPETLFPAQPEFDSPAPMPLSQILYRIHTAPADLFEVFNDPAEIAAGTFHIQGTIDQTINLCRDELNKANYDVMQLGRHKLLGYKLENRSWSAPSQGLQIELLVEQSETKGTIVTYSLSES